MRLLSRSPLIHSDDPEATEHVLRTVYGATGFAVSTSHGFEAVANHLKLPNVDLTFCGFGAPRTTVDFSESGFARMQIALKGSAATILNGDAFAINEQQSCLIPPGGPLTVVYEPGYEQLFLRMKTAALERTLTTLLGAKPRTGLKFYPIAVTVQPTAVVLRDLAIFLASQLDSTAAELPSPVLLELEQALLVTFLSAHLHNFSEELERTGKEAAPRVVRLAEEYIEASWDRAITIEELASQTNTSIRSLYAAFKKSRGYSPTTFAKTIRLRRANQMLLEPNQSTSVSVVAFKCGFGNLGTSQEITAKC